MQIYTFILCLTLLAGNAIASAVVTRNQASRTLVFESHLYLYGDVTEELAKSIEAEINKVWNNGVPQALLGGTAYTLKFSVTTSVLSEKEVRFKAEAFNDGRANFIRILDRPNSVVSSSFMIGNSNSGLWLKSQRLGLSTTAAHEYGHSIGLNHPDNESFQGPPRLMITDFYAVDPQYMVNGKLDLRMRRVTQLEVQELQLDKLKFNPAGVASIGSFKTVFLFDRDGNITN